MNDKLLINHIVNINQQYIGFLNFIHPNFDIIDDLDFYDNPSPIGIIYTGNFIDGIIKRLNSITHNWIIVNNHKYEDDLTTNEGLFKAILPIYYININNTIKKDETPIYKLMDYSSLIEKIKICLIDGSPIQQDKYTDQSVYNLFASILCSPDVFNSVYFNIVNEFNIHMVTSSILSFLNKVQHQQINNVKPNYARLISQSNRRYGKYIKQNIVKFLKSKTKPIIRLHQLLTALNRAR